MYVKDDKTFLIIQINQDAEINAFQFARFLNGLTYFYHEFCIEAGCEKDEELYLKIKVQSKGKVALYALTGAGLLGLSSIILLSDNPTFKLHLKAGVGEIEIEAKTDGLLKSLTNFFDANQERKENAIEFIESSEYMKATRKMQLDSIENIRSKQEERSLEEKETKKKRKKK
jgi:hypothetical protein